MTSKVARFPHALFVIPWWYFIFFLGITLNLQFPVTLFLYILGGIIGLSVLFKVEISRQPQLVAPAIRLAWACLFGSLSLLRDAWFIWLFGINAQSDSNYFINSFDTLIQGDAVDLPTYLPYQILNGLLNSLANPWGVILVQVVVAAGVLAWVVYQIGAYQLEVAILFGFFSVTNMTWAYMNRNLMTESLFTTLMLGGIVFTAYQPITPFKGWRSVGLGLGYGVMLIFRTGGILFVFPLLGFVWWRQGWRAVSGVLVGISLIIAFNSIFNQARPQNIPEANPNTLSWAFPLFYYHLFAAENGTQSAYLAELLATCEIDPNSMYRQNANYLVFLEIVPCFEAQNTSLDLLRQAYLEMLMHQPLRLSHKAIQEASVFPTFDVQSYPLILEHEIKDSTCYIAEWCLDLPRHYRQPVSKSVLISLIRYTRLIQQPYFFLLPPQYFETTYTLDAATFNPFITRESPQRNLAATSAALILIAALISLTCNEDRYLIFLIVAFFGTYIGATVLGQFYLARYAIPLSPFYSLLAAFLWVRLIQSLFPKLNLSYLNLKPIAYGLAVFSLMLAIYFAWQSQDKSAYGSELLISKAQQDLKSYPPQTVFNPSLGNYDWRVPNPFIHGEDTPAITRWRDTKAPAHLKAAGIEYLLVDHIWFRYVDETTAQMFFDPNYYILEQEWSEGDQHIYLYQVVGDQTEAPH